MYLLDPYSQIINLLFNVVQGVCPVGWVFVLVPLRQLVCDGGLVIVVTLGSKGSTGFP